MRYTLPIRNLLIGSLIYCISTRGTSTRIDIFAYPRFDETKPVHVKPTLISKIFRESRMATYPMAGAVPRSMTLAKFMSFEVSFECEQNTS